MQGSGPLAAAQSITDAVSTSSLSSGAKKDAFAKAILQALQQQGPTGFAMFTPNATAVLVAAAVSLGSGDAVAEAFAQVCPCPYVYSGITLAA